MITKKIVSYGLGIALLAGSLFLFNPAISHGQTEEMVEITSHVTNCSGCIIGPLDGILVTDMVDMGIGIECTTSGGQCTITVPVGPHIIRFSDPNGKYRTEYINVNAYGSGSFILRVCMHKK